MLEPIERPLCFPELNFLPVFLKCGPTISCCVLYAITALALAILLFAGEGGNRYYTENVNYELAARYAPSLLGTVTSMLFRITGYQLFRICPFFAMADQGEISRGTSEANSIAARYFPQPTFTSINTAMTRWVFWVLMLSGFMVAVKASLLTIAREGKGWMITFHTYPAIMLIIGHSLMLCCTLTIVKWLWSRKSGLIWDPVSIADQVSLFKECGLLSAAADFELIGHRPRTDKVYYRIGYWIRGRLGDAAGQIVYGIGGSQPLQS